MTSMKKLDLISCVIKNENFDTAQGFFILLCSGITTTKQY
jgi:hypothetical protein